MNTQTQQEIINLINKISIATTDKDNTDYAIELLIRYLKEIATDVDNRSMFAPYTSTKIGDAGAMALAAILKQNTNLEQLDIQNNNIGDKGTIALAEGLKHNTAVRFINLSHNKIGEKGIIALAEAIKQNTTIELVFLKGIELTEKGYLALDEVYDRIWEERKKKIPMKIASGVRVVYPMGYNEVKKMIKLRRVFSGIHITQ